MHTGRLSRAVLVSVMVLGCSVGSPLAGSLFAGTCGRDEWDYYDLPVCEGGCTPSPGNLVGEVKTVPEFNWMDGETVTYDVCFQGTDGANSWVWVWKWDRREEEWVHMWTGILPHHPGGSMICYEDMDTGLSPLDLFGEYYVERQILVEVHNGQGNVIAVHPIEFHAKYCPRQWSPASTVGVTATEAEASAGLGILTIVLPPLGLLFGTRRWMRRKGS